MNQRSSQARSYYQRNRERILARKRAKYRTDPAYRERCKAESRAAREPYRQPRVARLTLATGEVPALGVEALARAVRRSVSTINHWQTTGTLPVTPFRDIDGARLYAAEMIEIVAAALKRIRRPTRGDRRFRAAVDRGWSALGVPLAEAEAEALPLRQAEESRRSA